MINDKFYEPEKLDNAINSEYSEQDPCIALDESFMIFYSSRPGHLGKENVDLYISFKEKDGHWTEAINMGPTFNKSHIITRFPRLSPDGKYLAFTMEVFVKCKSVENTKKKLDKLASRKATGIIYDRIFIRHWDTWKDGRRSHLFAMPTAGGDVVDVMPDMDADTPSKPFGGPEEITFTRDGNGIVFTARDVGREEPWSTNFDLYNAPLDGSQPPKCLTEQNEAWDTQPVFSPDGKTLAYTIYGMLCAPR